MSLSTRFEHEKGDESYANEPRRSLVEVIPRDVKELFEYIIRGDDSAVDRLMNKKINYNFVDMKGNTALHMALKYNREYVVQRLLKIEDLDVGDCLFHAIKKNQINHVKLIMAKIAKVDPRYCFMPCQDSADFPHYLTPLMLAAQCNNVEIIEYLLELEHPEIPVPHEPHCLCAECVNEFVENDSLEEANKRIELYKSLCSPAYLILKSRDPILMVFYRVHELKVMANSFKVFGRKYEELIEKTEHFAADLISLCWSSDEVNLALSVAEGSDLRGTFRFPRLILAVDFKQHYFVAQPNIQAILEDAWMGDWYQWKSFGNLRCLLHFFGRILMLPFLYFICLVLPNHTLAKFYSIPVNRMISSLASYFFFLYLLYLEADRDKKNQKRYDILENVLNKVLILIFVVSHVMITFRMWTLRGTERFFALAWNWYDIVTQFMFVLTFLFWIAAFYTLYWQPDLERKYWHYLDPQLLAEGFLCIGTVMAYMRLLFIIQIDSELGPLQVSLGKMTKDFSHFVLIFAIVIGSFTAAMCRLYEYYDGMKQIDPDSQAESAQESSFVSPYETFKVLFWGLFGMSSQESGTVVIENISPEYTEIESINSHDFTQAVGNTLFSGYIVLTVIVLLNMLIAALSNTFQSVSTNVDIEWIFGRTEVYLNYMAQTVLPPPLSLLPALVGESALKVFFSKKKSKWDTEVERALPNEKDIEENYKQLIKRLSQRYFSMKEEEENLK